MDRSSPIPITPDQLESATLRSVIEEFVTRDGTEFTDLETKVAAVHELLRRGEARLWFDPETGTCNILMA